MDYKEMWKTLYLRLLVMKTECDRKEKDAYYTMVRMMESIEQKEKIVSDKIAFVLAEEKEDDYL